MIVFPRPLPRLLSLVIPVYNEQDTIPHLQSALTKFVATLPCPVEIVLVNDGSTDRSFQLLMEWSEADPRAVVLNLARNFGHQACATAGMDHASGDAVVLMDADLQDPPDVIHSMLVEYCKGYDVVYGRRIQRLRESAFKRVTAWLFYRLMRLLVYKDLPQDIGDFRLISRRCLDALISMRETHRFLRGMVAWVGFAQTTVPFVRPGRVAGNTKYTPVKMMKLALTAAISFSPAPLRVSFLLGLTMAAIGVGDTIYAVARMFLGYYNVPGWTSLLVVNCLVGGAILISIGVLGEYVGRIFEEVKGRPLYIVADKRRSARRETELTEFAQVGLRLDQ